MKSLSQFSLFGLLLAASVGFAGVTFAGGHGGEPPKASPQEQKCINMWKAGKKKQFAGRKVCQQKVMPR